MIADVESRIQAYMNVCKADNIKPTIYGIANVLGISDETLRHIRLGTYKKGKPYTNTPHTNRAVHNKDFDAVKQAIQGVKMLSS